MVNPELVAVRNPIGMHRDTLVALLPTRCMQLFLSVKNLRLCCQREALAMIRVLGERFYDLEDALQALVPDPDYFDMVKRQI